MCLPPHAVTVTGFLFTQRHNNRFKVCNQLSEQVVTHRDSVNLGDINKLSMKKCLCAGREYVSNPGDVRRLVSSNNTGTNLIRIVTEPTVCLLLSQAAIQDSVTPWQRCSAGWECRCLQVCWM